MGPSIQVAEAGGSPGVLGHPGLYSDFKASQDYLVRDPISKQKANTSLFTLARLFYRHLFNPNTLWGYLGGHYFYLHFMGQETEAGEAKSQRLSLGSLAAELCSEPAR